MCLLGAVKAAFKAAGLSRLAPREAAVAAIQAHLWPVASRRAPRTRRRGGRTLKAVQAGALVDAQELATAHPSVLSARSTSKGYGAMHFAAMAGALPLLDWLAEQGLDAAAPSSPPDGSAPLTPAEVAAEYKRDDAAAPPPPRRRPRLPPRRRRRRRGAAGGGGARRPRRGGGGAARARPEPARRPAVGRLGALALAASGGHVSVLRELLRRGAAAADGGAAALQAAVGGRHADAANLLHDYQHAAVTLTLGDATALPAAALAPADAPPPLLSALVLDAKLSSHRSVIVGAADPLLATRAAPPGLEAALLRWIDTRLNLPVWLPVDPLLYVQFGDAIQIALDALPSAAQRDANLHLVTSKADALKRLAALLQIVPAPSDVAPRCERELRALLGAELVDAHWGRLEPPMRSWLAKVIYFLPLTPWGRRPGGGGGDGEAPADLHLEIVLLELLSKGRLLYCLYEDEVEGGGPRASARNSVLPFQPDDPSRPYRKPELAADSASRRTRRCCCGCSRAVLPEEIRETYPQLVLLNGEGIGGPFRDVVAAQLAARWAMSGSATPATRRTPPAVPR